jgi:flagellar hook-associated protein FlgK
MIALVQFQSAYNAAAKLVSTVDELLDSLIAMV